jgi:hypothetical protein
MRRVTYSMNVSLDGYIVGPDGNIDWTYRPVGDRINADRRCRTLAAWRVTSTDPSLILAV